jgi:hypothetical protein
VRWAGDGSELWHVRVDLIAPDGEGWRVSAAHAELMTLLADDGAPTQGYGAGVDQGIGVEGQPVIGLSFWVRADDVSGAAATALATARAAAGSKDIAGPDYYDVVLVPRTAVLMPPDQHELRMPD